MKIYISILLILVFFVSCGKEVPVGETQKQDFLVDTKVWDDFSGKVFINKSGKVSSSQDIQLSSQASGRVSLISVKAGDTVKAGQIVARLDDTIGSYGINLQRASNGVERAQINYDSSKLQFEKQIFDTQVNIEKLERNLDTVKKDADQTIKQASDSLSNSQYQNLDSRSALQIEQLDNNITKSTLDFESKKILDNETIEGFKTNLKKDISSLTITLDDIIQFSDELLAVTEKNRFKNEDIQTFLGVKNIEQKERSKRQLIELISLRNGTVFEQTQKNITQDVLNEDQIIEAIDFITKSYEQTNTLLNSIEETLNSSLESVGILGANEISAFIGRVNGYQASTQGAYAGFLAAGNQTKSFLRTYKNSQDSIQKSLDLQKSDRNIQLKSLESGELSANVGLERTLLSTQNTTADLQDQILLLKNTLENTKKNYEVTLRSLQNAIQEAQISYASASKESSKLTITSPINGTVAELFIDKGQEMSPGVKIANIISDKTPEVQIALSLKEKQLVLEGQEAYVDVGVERIKGKIYAISDVADANLNYIATIVFESGVNILGNIATVEIPVDTDKTLLPINIVKTQGSGKANITIYTGTGFAQVGIVTGEVFGEYIEVLGCSDASSDCNTQKIVLNDTSNFDPLKFNIKEKQ